MAEEPLFQRLEEKMMILISEVEELRKKNQFLNQENLLLKNEKENSVAKLHELILLIDSINPSESPMIIAPMQPAKPVLVQG